jgi:hypothetical protein
MDASLYQTLPIIALAGFLATGVLISLRPGRVPTGAAWMAPAALSILFLGWSLYAVAREGLLGVWPEHVRGPWANQIWFDLLLAVGVGFSQLAPRARALGMRPLPWFVLIAAPGSIGLLAMLARCEFLAGRRTPEPQAQRAPA